MFAGATLAAILHAQTNPVPDKNLTKWNVKPNEIECLIKTLGELCGDQAIIRKTGNAIELEVDGKKN